MQAAVDVRNDILNGVIKSVVFGVAVTWIAVFWLRKGMSIVPIRIAPLRERGLGVRKTATVELSNGFMDGPQAMRRARSDHARAACRPDGDRYRLF